jgi:hypothetical protein
MGRSEISMGMSLFGGTTVCLSFSPAWLCVVIIRGMLIEVWISAIYLPGRGIGGVRSMDGRRFSLSLSLFFF